MVDLAPAIAGITCLRDFMKYVTGLHHDADVLGRVNEALAKVGAVQDKLQELREDNMRLLDENRELREELSDIEDWKSRLGAYELTKAPGGALVLFSKLPQHHTTHVPVAQSAMSNCTHCSASTVTLGSTNARAARSSTQLNSRKVQVLAVGLDRCSSSGRRFWENLGPGIDWGSRAVRTSLS